MQAYTIFPVPVYHEHYLEAEILKNNCIEKLKELESLDTTDYYYPAGSYSSYYNNSNILDLAEFVNLKSFIFDTVSNIHRSAGLGGELEFTNSWFSINRKHGYHEAHTHIPDIWSGVYYLDANHLDAPISFNNRNLKETRWPYRAPKLCQTDINSSQVTCSVGTGLLLIFPSYLEHSVQQQVTDSERITVAFNMNIKL